MKQNISMKQFFYKKKLVLIKQNISIKCVCVVMARSHLGWRLQVDWGEEEMGGGGREEGGGQAIWEGIGYEVNLQSELIEVNLKWVLRWKVEGMTNCKINGTVHVWKSSTWCPLWGLLKPTMSRGLYYVLFSSIKAAVDIIIIRWRKTFVRYLLWVELYNFYDSVCYKLFCRHNKLWCNWYKTAHHKTRFRVMFQSIGNVSRFNWNFPVFFWVMI